MEEVGHKTQLAMNKWGHSTVTGLNLPKVSALEAFLHYKMLMNRNLACLSLHAEEQDEPFIKACSK